MRKRKRRNPAKLAKCSVCKKTMRRKKGPGRPRKTHARCSKQKASKKTKPIAKARKSPTKKRAKKRASKQKAKPKKKVAKKKAPAKKKTPRKKRRPMTDNEKIDRYGPVVHNVQSASTSRRWAVRRGRGKSPGAVSSYSCGCQGWRFKKPGKPRSCRHVKAAAAAGKKRHKRTRRSWRRRAYC